MPEVLQNAWQQAVELMGGYLPNLLGALAILVVGWVVAKVIAAIVRGALGRTTLDNRLAGWMAGSEAGSVEVERIVSKGVFYVIMLFVLVAFFQALRLTIITEPLSALLTQLTVYAPRVLGAAALLLVAWVVASVLRKAVALAAGATELDRRLGGQLELEEGAEPPLSKTLGEAVYWLIFLLFLPAVLGALALQGLLTPVQAMTNEVLGFLPDLFGAAVILAVGWFVARLVQRIATNFLAAAGLDSLGERVGLTAALGAQTPSGLVGLILYVLILIPVLVSSLQALGLDAVTVPATNMLSTVMEALPTLFAAGVLVLIAYFTGKLISELVGSLLAGAGFDNVLTLLGFRAGGAEGRTPSSVVASLVFIATMLFASIEAARIMGFAALAEILMVFVAFAGQVILGVVVFGIGLFLANLAADTIRSSGNAQSGTLALAARASIIVLAGAMALREMGLADDIINLAFGLLLGAIAVAAALAFGLGARDVAGRQVEQWVGSLERKSSE